MSELFHKITNISKYYSKKVGHNTSEKEEFQLVRDTLVKYGMDTSFFDFNLKELVIENDPSIECSYNPKTNTIVYNGNKYALIHALFQMACNNIKTNNDLIGILRRDNKGKNNGIGFCEGIADYFTHLACPEYDPIFPFEERIISILSETYGIKMFNNHFKSNPRIFYELFYQDLLFVMGINKGLDVYTNSVSELTYIMGKNDLVEVIKKGSKLVNDIFDSVVNVCSKLFDLLELKGIDSSRYLAEMETLFESNNQSMIQIRNLVVSSKYKKIENVFNAIETEGLKL